MTHKKLIPLLLLLLLCQACTIEKRLYQKGWHVEWKKKIHTSETPAGTDELTEQEVPVHHDTEEGPEFFPAASGDIRQPITPVVSDQIEEAVAPAEAPVIDKPTDDSVKVIIEDNQTPDPDREELDDYNRATLFISLLLTLLFLCCVAGIFFLLATAVTWEVLFEIILLLLLALIFMISTLMFLAIRANSKPDRVGEKERNPAEEETEQAENKKREAPIENGPLPHKKRNAIIFLSVLAAFGTIIYLFS